MAHIITDINMNGILNRNLMRMIWCAHMGAHGARKFFFHFLQFQLLAALEGSLEGPGGGGGAQKLTKYAGWYFRVNAMA